MNPFGNILINNQQGTSTSLRRGNSEVEYKVRDLGWVTRSGLGQDSPSARIVVVHKARFLVKLWLLMRDSSLFLIYVKDEIRNINHCLPGY